MRPINADRPAGDTATERERHNRPDRDTGEANRQAPRDNEDKHGGDLAPGDMVAAGDEADRKRRIAQGNEDVSDAASPDAVAGTVAGGDRSNRAARSGATGERNPEGAENRPEPKNQDEKGLGGMRRNR